MTKLFLNENVSNWTKYIKISDFDTVIIPYNDNNEHWTLVQIDLKAKTVS